MNIAFLIDKMCPSGVASFVLELGPFLVRAGHRVAVVACSEGLWSPRLAEHGIEAVLVPPRPWESAIGYGRRMAEVFSTSRFDVVFLNNGVGVRPAMLGLHRWPDSVVAVPVMHNDLARVYNNARPNQAAWNVAVGISPKVRDTAARLLPGKKVLCITYGIQMPTETQNRTRAAWGLPLRLLFVGGLSDQHKGILRLPLILAGCRAQGIPVTLTIIGMGMDKARLAAALEEHGVADLAEWRGNLPNTAVHEAMRTHHGILIPSRYEGLSLVAIEAQANGCVPIASRLQGVLDLPVEDQVTGYLVEQGDIPAYVDSVAMLADARHWQRFSQAGMERARRLFSVDTMGKRYLTLIEESAAGAYPLGQSRATTARTAYRSFKMRDFIPRRIMRWLAGLRRRIYDSLQDMRK